jgi:hypothetical protein
MTNASRRSTLKLGAAALVVGPSVIITRTASAGGVIQDFAGHKAGQFTVKIAGVYDQVPGVVAVDLGSLNFTKLKSEYSGIKISLAAGTDAKKMTINFWPEYTKMKKGVGDHKISVSLHATEGATPTLT